MSISSVHYQVVTRIRHVHEYSYVVVLLYRKCDVFWEFWKRARSLQIVDWVEYKLEGFQRRFYIVACPYCICFRGLFR